MTTPRQELAKYTSQSQMSSFFIDKAGYIFVSSYGAIGDGVTNDTVAVQAAIDAAIAANKNEVHFVGGKTYLINTLTNTSGITFIGDNVTVTGTSGITVVSFSSHLAEIAYNVKNASLPFDDTGDCGIILNALTDKNYIYFPEGVYRFTTGWVINDDFTTVIFHPMAKLHVVGNIDTIKIESDNCYLRGGQIYSDGITFGNGRYGIRVTGKNCKVENMYINNISYSAISDEGERNEYYKITGYNCGWDCGQNLGKNTKWKDCKAIRTGRHGFSTDASEDIWFIDCYVEDLGRPTIGEGQDAYHFENCLGGGVKNCKSKWTVNNPYVTTLKGVGDGLRLGIRVSMSNNITVDGLKISIDADFVPLDLTLLNWCYTESTVDNPQIVKMKNVIIDNKSTILTDGYLSAYANVQLRDCYFKGYVRIKQQSVAGRLTKLIDCVINGIDKTYYFYDSPFSTIGFEAINNEINNSKGLTSGGQFINSLFEKNIIENCYDGILLARNSGVGAKNVIIRQNYIKDIDNTAIQGSFNATAQELKIIENYFGGSINKLFVGEGGGCNALWKNNNAESGLTVTTLTTGTATTIASDMVSNYDVIRDGVTIRPANPDTSGATLVALETEVNELKAVLRTMRIITT